MHYSLECEPDHFVRGLHGSQDHIDSRGRLTDIITIEITITTDDDYIAMAILETKRYSYIAMQSLSYRALICISASDECDYILVCSQTSYNTTLYKLLAFCVTNLWKN